MSRFSVTHSQGARRDYVPLGRLIREGGKDAPPRAIMLPLGDGAVDRSRRVLEKIVSGLRHRRVLSPFAG
jgi:hypothetical protein